MKMPILTSPRLVLRSWSVGDAADLSRLAGAEEVFDTTENIPHPYTVEAAKQWITERSAAFDAGAEAGFAVCAKSGGRLLGGVGLRFEPRNHRAILGYWFAVSEWGNGYATEAARALMDWGFASRDLNRISAQFLLRNPASGRVMEKLGMREEAVLRSWAFKHGVFEDVAQYYILKSEWRTD